jgi:hypothetical protein
MKHQYPKEWIFLVVPFLAVAGCDKNRFSSSEPNRESVNEVGSVTAIAPETPETATPTKATAEKSVEVVSSVLLPQTQVGGVLGGHFDLDTSTQTYSFDVGSTAAHVHEYDDIFNITGVDFFNLLDPKLVNPSDIIVKDQRFRIIVANAQFSPGARITINGQSYLASDWQKRQLSALPVFSLSELAGTQKLTALTVAFDPKKSIATQLIPAETTLVRSNAQGPGGSYRAGALTIQMIDSNDAQIDAKLGVAKIGLAGMLWEATLFWHEKIVL